MIKLFTDTSANLTPELIKRYNINLVSFSYFVDGKPEDYQSIDGFDGKTFYDKMRGGHEIKTSMVNPETFREHFEECLKAGDDVLYVGMSGGISGTANSAQIAVDELSQEYPKSNIFAIDTYAASLGEGLLVIKAAILLSQDWKFGDVVNYIQSLRKNMCQFFVVDSLEYLKKGGRISAASASIGTLLSIKPLLMGNEIGQIVLCGKAIGMKKAISLAVQKYVKLHLDENAEIGIAHADNPETSEFLLQKLRENGFKGACLTVCYEPVTGAHVGPGTVALFFFGRKKNE